MAIIIARRRRGTWEGVPVAIWCSEWICRIGGGLVPHVVIILAAYSLPQLQGVVVGRAPTIIPNDWFCTRLSSFFNSPVFSATSSGRQNWRSRREARGGHLSGGGTNLTFLSPPEPKINPMHRVGINKIDSSYMVCRRLFRRFFRIPSPGLSSSFPLDRYFSKGARFSNNFSRSFSRKNCVEWCSPDYYTTPVLSSRSGFEFLLRKIATQ